MKTCLKRSEIIKQLKRFFFQNCTIDIYRMSDVSISNFDRYYFCIVNYSGQFQVVTLHLLYGWVCVFIQGCYDNIPEAQNDYLVTMHRYIFEAVENLGINERD